MPFGLVDKAEEDRADGLADEGAVGHEFPVDAMEDCFEVVSFPGVFAVEQVDKRSTEPEGGREGGQVRMCMCLFLPSFPPFLSTTIVSASSSPST